jgi:inorganic pyrophosphatase
MNHLWHDIPVGESSPEIFNVVVEIPKSCKNKYEVDKELGIIRVDRVLHSSSIYPHNYGFIPQTYAHDNDPLDVLLLSQVLIHPGCVVYAKAIGVMEMVDSGKVDSKILAVQVGDPAFNHYKDAGQLPEYMVREIKRFFEEYKILEKKEVLVEDFEPASRAKEIIVECTKRYNEIILPARRAAQLEYCKHTQCEAQGRNS